MYMHPEITSQLAHERRSDMLTSAQNQRLARQFRGEPGTGEQPTRRLRRPLRLAGRLLTAFQARRRIPAPEPESAASGGARLGPQVRA